MDFIILLVSEKFAVQWLSRPASECLLSSVFTLYPMFSIASHLTRSRYSWPLFALCSFANTTPNNKADLRSCLLILDAKDTFRSTNLATNDATQLTTKVVGKIFGDKTQMESWTLTGFSHSRAIKPTQRFHRCFPELA
jgi:hypothetical protein